MASFLEKFKSIVDEIESNPLLEIVEFSLNAPATNEVFEVVEKKIGVPLANPIRSFYQEANGLKLHWRIVPTISDEDLEKISGQYDDYLIEIPENEDNPFAKVDLIPIEDCIINCNWEETIITYKNETFEFAGVTYQHSDFGRRLRPFDVFSTFQCMAFLLEEGCGNPKVLMLSNHYIQWNGSRITDFSSYMEMLFVTRGIVSSREKIYGKYKGDRKPPLITGSDYWTEKHIPKLFRKNE